MSIKVSIDASGGDFGLPVTINAGINALKIYDDLLVNFVGDQTGIRIRILNLWLMARSISAASCSLSLSMFTVDFLMGVSFLYFYE